MYSISVLMSTYNGSKYLEEQINSLILQKDVQVSILVRDDGSTDETVDILKKYSNKGILKYYQGHNMGPAYSFLDLIMSAPESDFYAFCDQDDIWESDKLSSAVQMLSEYNSKDVALYYCGARVFNLENKVIGQIVGQKEQGYIDALIHNSVLGCSMVFTSTLLSLLRKYSGKKLLMHDDLAIKLCLAVGGKVIRDDRLLLNYRIHGSNAVGTQEKFLHALNRRIKSLYKQSCERSMELQDIYEIYKEDIPLENIYPLETIAYYKKSFLGRFRVIFDKQLKANNMKTTIHFKFAVLLGFY